jgi:AraC-like DNA-binding protein
VQNLVNAKWSVVLRRLGELIATVAPVMAVLALPIVLPIFTGHDIMYAWASHEKVEGDHLLHHKAGYLNPTFFLIRFVFYFGFWTLMSRFFRARLPAPKRYLSSSRLVRAARLLENEGLSVANVADHLDYSSPQSFGRHVRAQLGLTASEFRRRFDGEGMLHRFREELVLPHLSRLRTFSPLTAPTPLQRHVPPAANWSPGD